MEQVIKIEAYLSTMEVDNGRGGIRYCTLTSVKGKDVPPVIIEFSPYNGNVGIAGVELTSTQRKVLIKFLKQKD